MLQDVNLDIMDEIAVTVVAKTALSPVNVTDLQDDVTVGVNQDGQETNVTKVGLF